MKKVGVRANRKKVKKELVDEIISWLCGMGIETVILENPINTLPEGLDMLVVMGGDGTVLGGARAAAAPGVPILCIDFGGLGFLNEIKYSEAKDSLAEILLGRYHIEERVMLEASFEINGGGETVSRPAANDIVIAHRSGRILRLKVLINNEEFTEFSGDGLIASSSTGSTAYSLSAGGPIVSPKLDVIVLNAICPHTLFSRALVTCASDIIRVELPEDRLDLTLTIDGQEDFSILSGSLVTIHRYPFPMRFIRVKPSRFFKTVREKFYLERGKNSGA